MHWCRHDPDGEGGSEVKSILVTIMLLAAAIAIYNATIGGDNGTKALVENGGGRMNAVIQSIDP
jgi:hypothetical protein